MFLTKTIGEIGDRHSGIRNYPLENNLYLPFVTAPLEDKVVAVNFNRESRSYVPYYANYPYLKSINGIEIVEFIKDAQPEEIKAP
ncbi:hypothetical protein [Chondrinema litorale]|uniref:hypothetical protein n=1 Tax=Chondrinema litorale TaxID=2994555 RepID=UPI002542CD05|nr:hypothetical protein [Chondrinema litorale]UZR97586.1 hypothetical protein OQ292_26545 [Chondrinema litorale]